MEEENIKSDFQFVDNYVRNSNIEILKRNIKKGVIEMNLSVGISEIIELDNEKTAEARLKNNVKVVNSDNNEVYIKISVEMAGNFKCKNLSHDEFEDYIKYSGIPMLSQTIRAYIISLTSLSGINPIRIPMVNFREYFDDAEVIEEN